MLTAVKFQAIVELGGKTATGIAVPEEVVAGLGGGKRPRVVVTIGPPSYRTTLAAMGGRFLIPLSAENRSAAGVAAGDAVEVELTPDEAPREVAVPDDLAAAIAAVPAAEAAFGGLAFSHRKEWVRWVVEAKKPETRATRTAKTVDALAEGRKTH